ncbi:Spo11 Type II DNA topoisomerase VI subunit A [Giardia muris]|uniref:DNA topoisomerase (ATP-hydrolyzing) n=1 Tax=Giardia muris TaxID=5742 RepID=A0A4Z1SWM8_GIAMU|nr:Spo11 Type II DNA topoisomerase VI subunit A [Giardia muris]|eukprot:TNJ30164.1 Spo11 Type II DNA topoisomerase VI subunit A [Giardia muris]
MILTAPDLCPILNDEHTLQLYKSILLSFINSAKQGEPRLPISLKQLQTGRGITLGLKAARVLRILTESARAIKHTRFLTMRGIYYSSPNLFDSQTVSDRLIDELCRGLELTREDMHLRAAAKGLLFGPATICTALGEITANTVSETSVTVHFFYLQQIRTPARFALVVEKDTIFERIIDVFAELRTVLGQDFLLITGRGYPDLATRALMNFFHRVEFPILGLADGDAHGMAILYNYGYGGISAATIRRQGVQGGGLTAPSLIPIGLFTSQIRTSYHGLQVNAEDLKLYGRLITLLRERHREEWARQVEALASLGMKYELEELLANPEDVVRCLATIIRNELTYF